MVEKLENLYFMDQFGCAHKLFEVKSNDCIVDKDTGALLYEPIPPHPYCTDASKYEEYSKRKVYFELNGVPLKDYNKYQSWKNQLISMGADVSTITYDDYKGCKLRSFVRHHKNSSQIDYNEWNW